MYSLAHKGECLEYQTTRQGFSSTSRSSPDSAQPAHVRLTSLGPQSRSRLQLHRFAFCMVHAGMSVYFLVRGGRIIGWKSVHCRPTATHPFPDRRGRHHTLRLMTRFPSKT